MRRKFREIRDVTVALAAIVIIAFGLVTVAFEAISKTEDQKECERWARVYKHDYCND